MSCTIHPLYSGETHLVPFAGTRDDLTGGEFLGGGARPDLMRRGDRISWDEAAHGYYYDPLSILPGQHWGWSPNTGHSQTGSWVDVPSAQDGDFNNAVALGKREILEDFANGTLTPDVRNFSELHDYVDANEYAGLCAQYSDHDMDFAQRVQDALDTWLRSRSVSVHREASAETGEDL